MRALYDSKSKLDDRGIKYLLSEENKYKTWLKVEGALALSQAKEGFIPKEAAEEIASFLLRPLIWKKWKRSRQRWDMVLFHL